MLPFSAGASTTAIATALQVLGFADVQVYGSVAALPSGWPSSTTVNPLPGTRWFYAKWSGLSGTLPRPPQLELLWVSRSPALVAAQAAL
jgi:hypothetical protein